MSKSILSDQAGKFFGCLEQRARADPHHGSPSTDGASVWIWDRL